MSCMELTFITLGLLSELGEVDGVFTRLGHLWRECAVNAMFMFAHAKNASTYCLGVEVG